MMEVINLTPHALVICDESKNPVLTAAPSGLVARIKTQTRRIGQAPVFSGGQSTMVSLYETEVVGEPHCYRLDAPDEIVPLPDPKPDAIYAVSGIFRAYFDRPDFYQPGQLVRGEGGLPVGCIGLSR